MSAEQIAVFGPSLVLIITVAVIAITIAWVFLPFIIIAKLNRIARILMAIHETQERKTESRLPLGIVRGP